MSLPILTTRPAKRHILQHVKWLAENRSAALAVRWMDVADAAIAALNPWPQSRPLARENDRSPHEIREEYFGVSKPPTHRLVFRVLSDRVEVFAVRGITQDDLPDHELP